MLEINRIDQLSNKRQVLLSTLGKPRNVMVTPPRSDYAERRAAHPSNNLYGRPRPTLLASEEETP